MAFSEELFVFKTGAASTKKAGGIAVAAVENSDAAGG